MFNEYKSATTTYFYIESTEYPYYNAKIYDKGTHFEIEAGDGFNITGIAFAKDRREAECKAFELYMNLNNKAV